MRSRTAGTALGLFLMLAGCVGERRTVEEAAPAPHPDGPCVTVRGGVCEERDAAFTAAKAAAVAVDPSAGPVDSGILEEAALWAVELPLRAGDRVALRLVSKRGGATFTVRSWWPAAGGWGAQADRFTPAEPGALLEQAWEATHDGTHLVAVEAEPSGVFRVVMMVEQASP